jgi:hypothetical protein
MAIIMKSQKLVVTSINRKSTARYAVNINLGDVLELVTGINDTTGGSGGRNYAIVFDLYVNGALRASLTQNEVPRLETIFDLKAS